MGNLVWVPIKVLFLTPKRLFGLILKVFKLERQLLAMKATPAEMGESSREQPSPGSYLTFRVTPEQVGVKKPETRRLPLGQLHFPVNRAPKLFTSAQN